jgi:hypothetical protein
MRPLLATAGLALLIASCGGGGGDSTPTSPAQGTLRLALVDAPACGYDSVFVTVVRARVHLSSSAGETDAGWVDIALPAARRVDLLTLTNGVLEELGQTALPAGRYTQMRLLLAPNTAADPLANAVTPSGGAQVALDTPSAVQSGLKMNVDIQVQDGQVADFLIDFDACQSVVPRGNSGRFNLKPVLRVLPRLAPAGARIVGHVTPGATGLAVSAQLAGVPVLTTTPDAATGRFELYPVPPGSYSVVLAGSGYTTGVITGVPVMADVHTVLNPSSLPIAVPAAGSVRTVSATIAAVPVPEAASLRVQQTLTGGLPIQVLARPALGDGTAVALPLPAAPPRVAPYAAALVFADDAAPAVVGRYTVTARIEPAAPGLPAEKSADIDLSPAVPDPLPALLFTFP